MKKRIVPVVLAAALSAVLVPASGAGATATATAPSSAAQIERYHDSGAWARDATRVTKRATAYLRDRLRHGADPRKLAVVLDVDDTALSTYDCMKEGGFAKDRLTACAVIAKLPAVPQTLAFFRYARAHRVAVVFVTGRPDYFRTPTLAALQRVGYRGSYQLVLRPGSDARPSVVPYKTAARRALERAGRRVAVNLGDQRSDLLGGFAERAFRLPNPMYLLP